MAPTNRLIEARRAELRVETSTQKPSGTKAATVRTGAKRPASQSSMGQPKTRTKPKA
jgi:hypothetical protein